MLEKLCYLTLFLTVIACNPSADHKSRPINTVQAANAQNSFGQSVATEGDLPTCSATSNNEIAFIRASNKIVVCQDSQWSDINLTNSGPSSGLNTYLNQQYLPACDFSRENTIAYVFEESTIMECQGGAWSAAEGLQGQDGQSYRIYETQDLAGECNAEREGEFNYITSEKKFIYCEDDLWTDVDVSGEDGTQVSETWRDVWTNNVQSTALISNSLTIYNNTDDTATDELPGVANNAKAGNERCRLGSSGSGFVVAQDVLATNAHVANTWIETSLQSLYFSCRFDQASAAIESIEKTFNRIFDYCVVTEAPVPNVMVQDFAAQTPGTLLSIIDNTAILPTDNDVVEVKVSCFDSENRADVAVDTPFATLILDVMNQISFPEGELSPVATRSLEINFASSEVIVNPLLGNAQVGVFFPGPDGQVDTSLPPVPVTNLDMSIGCTDDLALLQAATGQRTPVTLSALDFSPDGVSMDGARLNEDVLLIGYSRGDPYAHFVTGNLNQTVRFDVFAPFQIIRDQFFTADDRLLYMYDLVAGGGSSGSAIFNLAGEVIAYNFAGDTSLADTDFAYGLQVKHLRDVLALPRAWMVPNTMAFLQRNGPLGDGVCVPQ